jgi:uncharacterized protein
MPSPVFSLPFRRFTVALVMGLLLTVSMAAPYAVAQSEVPADKKPHIDRLMELMNIDTMMEQSFTATIPQVEAAIRNQNPTVSDEEIAIVIGVFQEETIPFVNETLRDVAPMMARYYTADELSKIVDFYETPVGQKALQIMPQVMVDMQNLLIPRMQVFQQKAIKKIKIRLKEAGY